MLRFLVLLALLVLVWLALRRFSRWLYTGLRAAGGAGAGPEGTGRQPVTPLVRCGSCGTYVPKALAERYDGSCSDACRRLGRAGTGS